MRRVSSVRLALAVLCAALLPAGSSSASPPPAGASWGFFAYTKDFLSGLSNARWGRATTVLWAQLERPPGSGTYDWRNLDSQVKLAQKVGMNAVLVLKA